MSRHVRGRPPRAKTIGFGVTDEERSDLQARATVAGYATLGAWVRDAIFGIQVAPPPAQIDQDTNAQLRGMGANLNQALKRINGGLGADPDWQLIREASRAVILLRQKLVGLDPGVPVSDRIAGVPSRLNRVVPSAPKPPPTLGKWDV